jgi:hypothetical protein
VSTGPAAVTVAPLRPHRGWLVPLLLMFVIGVGRPLCLLAQLFIPLMAVTTPLPPEELANVLRHRIRIR